MGLYNINDTLPQFRNAVITIGTFDGVHEGHKTIINKLCAKAREIDGESILITFDPHPRQVISPDRPVHFISSNKEKYEEIFKIGVDHIVIIPFTRAFSLMTAEDYVHNFLIKHFQPSVIIIGYDHQFGHDRKGSIHTLREMLSGQVEIIEIPEHLIDDAHVSSTQIRQAITAGDIIHANTMLGRTFKLDGLVIHGNKLGRQIGFPTANLQLTEQHIILPPTGVYAVRVSVLGHIYDGVLSIGTRPTVTDDAHISYEVYILDFHQDIYGARLSVHFLAKLRDELKLSGIEELISYIHKDIEDARAYFPHNS